MADLQVDLQVGVFGIGGPMGVGKGYLMQKTMGILGKVIQLICMYA